MPFLQGPPGTHLPAAPVGLNHRCCLSAGAALFFMLHVAGAAGAGKRSQVMGHFRSASHQIWGQNQLGPVTAAVLGVG